MQSQREIDIEATIQEALSARLALLKTRQEKTKETASFLFFQHGIYPSAKTVLSYTKQGSITDVNRDLQDFWQNLRDKSKVNLDAPSIPQEVLKEFATSLEKLWSINVSQAQQTFDIERTEMQEKIEASQRNAQHFERLMEQAQAKEAQIEQELQLAIQRHVEFEKTIASQASEITLLTNTIDEVRASLSESEKSRAKAEEQFSRDLEQERLARQREAEQMHGDINFAKMQIASARQSEQDLRETLKSERLQKDAELASYRQRANTAMDTIGALKIELVELRGRYAEIERQNAELKAQLQVQEKAKAVPSKIVRKQNPVVRRKLRRA